MNRPIRQRGVAMVYASVFIVALTGVVSLAVDWGRAQTAKTELQDAVDAAARYAAAGLADNTCLARAQAAAAQNTVDGTTLTLLASDVETGTWNVSTRAFVANGTPTNSVRVTGRRNTARGNAVPLVFGRIIGMNSVAVNASSVASQSAVGVVGLDGLSVTGGGTVSRTATEGGGVTTASNATYTFGGGSNVITGDALYFAAAPAGTVTGRKVPLSSAIDYPTPTMPGTYTRTFPGSANSITSGSTYQGNYTIYGNWTAGTGGVFALTGDTYVYVAGTATVSGTFAVVNNGFKMYVIMTNGGACTFSNTLPLKVSVYAPDSAVTLNGPGTLTGSVVGKTLAVKAALQYTDDAPIAYSHSGGGASMDAGGVSTMK